MISTRRVPTLLASAALSIAACTSGPSVDEFTPAHTGSGILFEFRFAGDSDLRMSGELLAVEGRTLLVVVHDLGGSPGALPATPFVARVERRAIRRAKFGGRWRTGSVERSVPERVRLSSRYPSGVTPELLDRLLDAYGQAVLVVYPGAGEPTAEASEGFRDQVQTATRRYHDVSNALADGFRPVGDDAPAMGRHWVNSTRLLSGELRAERPAILTYVQVGGRKVLAGVAYAMPVAALSAAARVIPAPTDAWHVHDGALEEESHTFDHGAHPPSTGSRGVAVLHAWVWVENPSGMFEPDNWALPWLRLGLTAPSPLSVAASKAAALCSREGVSYFAFHTRRSSMARSKIDGASTASPLETARQSALAACRELRGEWPNPAVIERLEHVWDSLDPAVVGSISAGGSPAA